MKLCSRCKERPRRSASQRWCKQCHAAYVNAHRPKQSELSPEAKARAYCRNHSNMLQHRGTLKPEPCAKCGSGTDIQKHHPDYSNPRLVVWLCAECHRMFHGELHQRAS